MFENLFLLFPFFFLFLVSIFPLISFFSRPMFLSILNNHEEQVKIILCLHISVNNIGSLWAMTVYDGLWCMHEEDQVYSSTNTDIIIPCILDWYQYSIGINMEQFQRIGMCIVKKIKHPCISVWPDILYRIFRNIFLLVSIMINHEKRVKNILFLQSDQIFFKEFWKTSSCF